MLHQCTLDIFGSCDLSISMSIYGNIRDFAYLRYKFDVIFCSHFDLFIKIVVSVLFQYSECTYYHDYVETWVSNLKFFNDYDIGPEMF